MWFLSRPDASTVWKNDKIRQHYARYRAILDGEKKARYLIVKKTTAPPFSNDTSLEELWTLHGETSESFHQLLAEIDKNESDLQSIPTPERSFLDLKVTIIQKILQSCHFCERRCEVDRTAGELGFCRVGEESYVASAFLHSGEESVLVPSGTIFFTGCTFTCAFCQNYDISQEWCTSDGSKVHSGAMASPKKVALLSEKLWKDGAKNINYVGGDPTPNLHTIIKSLLHFDANITLLWNSNMYQSKEATILLLDLMDFWLPDFKFWDNAFAKKMSGITDYREIITRNISMAYTEGSGEILIRHLIMPDRVEKDTFPILEWCAEHVPNALVNLMDQYHPDYLVKRDPSRFHSIKRRINPEEWRKATTKADELGILWRPVS
ncbi:MAG: radical SAM protein [Asgard group archaeon]|nr:radical SAM protein [Asgard group archaeon]